MQRVIFDLDGTLLNAHWDDEREFFRNKIGNHEKTEEFIKDVGKVLQKYETTHNFYSIFDLNKFMNEKGYDFTEDLVLGWIKFSKNIVRDDICEGVIELLDICREKDLKMSVATNWFTEAQAGRLQRAGILNYFDKVIGGDYFLKPGKVNFLLAANGTPVEECYVIGNDYENDYLGAINAGMKAVYLDENHSIKDIVEGIKKEEMTKTKKLIKKR